jgi:hypothetical protein
MSSPYPTTVSSASKRRLPSMPASSKSSAAPRARRRPQRSGEPGGQHGGSDTVAGDGLAAADHLGG